MSRVTAAPARDVPEPVVERLSEAGRYPQSPAAQGPVSQSQLAREGTPELEPPPRRDFEVVRRPLRRGAPSFQVERRPLPRRI
jgi:hypothetical protein